MPKTVTPRLRPVAIAGAVITVLILSGCGSPAIDDDPTKNTANAAALLPPAEGVTEYPLTLETPFGDTELGERPERIAVVSGATKDSDALIGLGGLPVLAPSTLERNPWVADEIRESIEVLWISGSGMEVSAEEVASAEPDLIVSLMAPETLDQARFDQLSAIAPVLYRPDEDDITWQDATTALGEALDLAETAAERIAETTEAVSAVAQANPQFAGKSLSFVQVFDEEYGANYFNPRGSAAGELFTDLGFTYPEAASEFTGPRAAISSELTALIDADVLLLTYTPGTSYEYFTESPLYLAVPAVVEGRVAVYEPDDNTVANPLAWGFGQPSTLSLPWVVELVADLANEAISE